jgi:hypothetical protein
VALAKQIGSNVLATPQQITDRLFVFRRDVDRGEGARAVQDGELPSVTAIGLDPIARAVAESTTAR